MQKQTLALFWRFTQPYKIQRTLALLFPVLAVIVNAVIAPYVLSTFLNRLEGGGITLENSWQIIALYAGLVFTGEVILWRVALYFTWTFEVNGQRQLYLAIFDKLARESLSFHASRFGGSLISQSSKLIGAFERFWDMIIWSVVPMITTIVGSIITLAIVGPWQYSIFLTFYSLIFMVITITGSRFLAARNKTEAAASNKNSGFLADMVTNVATVKAFGKERAEYRGASRVISDWHDSATRLKWGVIGATSAFSSLAALGAISAFIFAVLGAERGLLSVGTIYLMLIYALNVNRQLWEMNSITRMYNRIIGDAHEMGQILHTDFDLIDQSNKTLAVKKGEVVFNDVTFTHDKGEGEQVFRNFSLVIPAGQRVGIVGQSGSGKTTLTRILLRFSDIDSGTIMLDNQDIAGVSQQSLHESIAYVAQEPMLFHRPLGENIAYGKQNATRAQIIAATEKAHAMEFVKKLPEGFDTVVGERGVKLSGGQRQRIAIARAMLKDAPILVLDEATSALDSESEKLIQASLDELMKGRTSIVIAHRLSTIAKLDRIIVLDKGEIAEDGTHDELIKKKGIYAKLWSHQSGGFIEE